MLQREGNRFNRAKIDEFRKNNNLSIAKFCKGAGISYGVYAKLNDENSNYRIVALFKIARFMKIRVCELFI